MQNLAQEQLGSVAFWIVEKFDWIILLNDLPLIHKDNTVGHLTSETHFMGYT